MFFEIPTIWKKKPPCPDPNTTFETPKSRSVGRTYSTTKFARTKALSIWQPRRIGVFFSHNCEPPSSKPAPSHERCSEVSDWTCLVLVEPAEIKPKEHHHEFHFCYRKIHNGDTQDRSKPRLNANTRAGRGRYTVEEDRFHEIVKYIIHHLLPKYLTNGQGPTNQRCASLVTHLGKDIFWGWEEFATQVVQFAAVFSSSA